MGTNQLATNDQEINSSTEDRDLRVVLEIERGGPCGIDCFDGDIVDVDVRFDEHSCNVDAAVRDPADDSVSTRYFQSDLCSYCPGKVFSEHDCLPRYMQIEEGGFVVETYVSDTETVADLVSDIREVCQTVSLRSIVSNDTSEVTEDCSIDISILTKKQREAVSHAQEMGYYDPDSSVRLDELADRIGISPSALSQRLKRAEGNVLRQLSCECSCWDDVD